MRQQTRCGQIEQRPLQDSARTQRINPNPIRDLSEFIFFSCTLTMPLPYTLQPIAALPGHTDRTWHAAWNPVRSLVTTCSADKTVRVWAYDRDEKSGWRFKHVSTIETGHAKTVRALAWAPGGKTLATASFDANIGVWEQEGGDDEEGGGEWECASTLEGHETECKSVAYSANGNYLASCSRDKTVWIWEGPSFISSPHSANPYPTQSFQMQSLKPSLSSWNIHRT